MATFDEVDKYVSELFGRRRRQGGGPVTRDEVLRGRFNVFIGVVILLNAVFLALETDLADPNATEISERLVWLISENVFLVIFLLEVFIRLKWDGVSYYRDFANLAGV